MKPVVFNPIAIVDLDEITDFIAADDPKAAQRVRTAVLETASKLGQFPGLGCRPTFGAPRFADIRFLPVKQFRNYLIFYLEHGLEVEVLRIVHGARESGRLFKQ